MRTLVCFALVTILIGLAPAEPHAKGVKTPLIVLDPGHGGTNRGAHGMAHGRHEKELTLVLAKRAAKALKKMLPRARVRLTRRQDRYLTLAQRRDLANRWGATVFVSIHLNASRSRSQSGFETYVLSTEASDKEAVRLAHAENGRDANATRPAPRKGGNVAAILGDLQQRATHARSLALAKSMQRALRAARPKANNRGVRQAPFDVLLGLRMPGVLVEVGFIDHVIEGKQMVDKAVQARIADAIAKGVKRFVAPARAPRSRIARAR
jgi:N-acetylmuramoyl-L-alanine amidase